MATMGSLDHSRLELVGPIVSAMYDDLVHRAIENVRNLRPFGELSGDDSKLDDVWEEFKDQLQNGESFCFEEYEQTIRSVCERHVGKLDVNQQRR